MNSFVEHCVWAFTCGCLSLAMLVLADLAMDRAPSQPVIATVAVAGLSVLLYCWSGLMFLSALLCLVDYAFERGWMR